MVNQLNFSWAVVNTSVAMGCNKKLTYTVPQRNERLKTTVCVKPHLILMCGCSVCFQLISHITQPTALIHFFHEI